MVKSAPSPPNRKKGEREREKVKVRWGKRTSKLKTIIVIRPQGTPPPPIPFYLNCLIIILHFINLVYISGLQPMRPTLILTTFVDVLIDRCPKRPTVFIFHDEYNCFLCFDGLMVCWSCGLMYLWTCWINCFIFYILSMYVIFVLSVSY